MKPEKLEKMYGNVTWTDKPHSFIGLPWNFTRYVLTDKKLIIRKGFLNIKEESIELYKIIDVSMFLPITQRIFGCGTLMVSSKDSTAPMVNLSQVKNPYEIHRQLEEAITTQKKEYGVLGKDMYGTADDDCDCEH